MILQDIQDPSKGFQDAISHLDLFISNAEKQGGLIQAADSVKARLTPL